MLDILIYRMDEAFFSMIKNEVRSYLHSVENLRCSFLNIFIVVI